jgi:hypothetical protein
MSRMELCDNCGNQIVGDNKDQMCQRCERQMCDFCKCDEDTVCNKCEEAASAACALLAGILLPKGKMG